MGSLIDAMSNEQRDSRVLLGQSRKAHDSPSKCLTEAAEASSSKRLRPRRKNASVPGVVYASPVRRFMLGAGRVVATAVGGTGPSAAAGVVQPPLIRRPPTLANLFNAGSDDSAAPQGTEPSDVVMHDVRPGNFTPSNAAKAASTSPASTVATPIDAVSPDTVSPDA